MEEIPKVPVFRQQDFNNLELVRQVILYRLKHDRNWTQFDYVWSNTGSYIEFESHPSRNRFVVLANEIMWTLLMQGVITPGKDAPNPTLPWFRVTDYGQKVLEAERFLPHDPTGYLEDLRASAKTALGQVTIAYIEEALRCFNVGCHLASVLLLGVAAESVFLSLCEIVRSSLQDPQDWGSFDRLDDKVKPKHRWIVKKYQDLPGAVRRNQLPESLDLTLTSLYDLIRRQRNDLGHPQEKPPDIDREQAFIFFRMFPGFVRDIEAFADYCKRNGL